MAWEKYKIHWDGMEHWVWRGVPTEEFYQDGSGVGTPITHHSIDTSKQLQKITQLEEEKKQLVEENNKLLANQKPTDLPANWKEQIEEKNQRPAITVEKYNEILDSKGMSADWEAKMVLLSKLEKQNNQLTEFLKSQKVTSLNQLGYNFQSTVKKCDQLEKKQNELRELVDERNIYIDKLSKSESSLKGELVTANAYKTAFEKRVEKLEDEAKTRNEEMEKSQTKNKELEDSLKEQENKTKQVEQEKKWRRKT